jgi:hypothetical protein
MNSRHIFFNASKEISKKIIGASKSIFSSCLIGLFNSFAIGIK